MSPQEIHTYASIIDGLGTLGVLALVLWSLINGRIVTRSHLKDVEEAKEAEIGVYRDWISKNT